MVKKNNNMEKYGPLLIVVALVVAVLFVLFLRKISKNKYRFINRKGEEIKDQTIIDQRKKEIEQLPLLQDRHKEIAGYLGTDKS